jgi:DNA-directed RNA polymerase specialized sigma subunit
MTNNIFVWEKNKMVNNYCKTLSRKNLWRVKNLGYEYEDLLQECAIVHLNCVANFDNIHKAQFMKYFKVSLNNMITDLSNKSRKEEELKNKVMDKSDGLNSYDPVPEIMLNLQISTSPRVIKDIINLADNMSDSRKGKYRKGLKNNRFLCFTLGFKPYKTNLVSYFKKCIQGE